jgi:siroheme synthase
VLVATLATIAAEAAAANLDPPATLVVGDVVRVRDLLNAECGMGNAESEALEAAQVRAGDGPGAVIPHSAFRTPHSPVGGAR